MEQRLRNELKTLPQNYANTDLSQLPFLDALLRETLRVYPPAPSPMPRVVPSGGLTVAGTFLPPGVCYISSLKSNEQKEKKSFAYNCSFFFRQTIVSCQPYSMHRIPEIFPNPERFDPDRWLNVSKENRDRMLKAWVPFSAGQRGYVLSSHQSITVSFFPDFTAFCMYYKTADFFLFFFFLAASAEVSHGST